MGARERGRTAPPRPQNRRAAEAHRRRARSDGGRRHPNGEGGGRERGEGLRRRGKAPRENSALVELGVTQRNVVRMEHLTDVVHPSIPGPSIQSTIGEESIHGGYVSAKSSRDGPFDSLDRHVSFNATTPWVVSRSNLAKMLKDGIVRPVGDGAHVLVQSFATVDACHVFRHDFTDELCQ
jgi:hypothetical protein